MLDGKGVYRGVQAEWTDWMGCFSKATLAKLDYVLTDTMTFPGPDGRRMKLWEKGADYGTPELFMDRYVDWHVQILEEPIDILVNVSWLPGAMAAEYDTWWTDARIARVIEAAVKNARGHRNQLELQIAGEALPASGEIGGAEVLSLGPTAATRRWACWIGRWNRQRVGAYGERHVHARARRGEGVSKRRMA